MRIDERWLTRGNFYDLSANSPTFMKSVRDELTKVLGARSGNWRINQYPAGKAHKHLYWLREGGEKYAEAQLFIEIARDYPVLSLGVSIEKAREDVAGKSDSKPALDRSTWDWTPFIKQLPGLLSTDIPEALESLQGPTSLRVQTKKRGISTRAWEDRTYTLTEGKWFQRHYRQVDSSDIEAYFKEIDKQKDVWAIVHCAHDFFPDTARKMGAADVAAALALFDRVRQKIRSPRAAGGSRKKTRRP